MSRPARFSSRTGARGVTLIELMIAMVLGLLIVAAVSAVYLSSRQTFRANDNLARVQENVRTAFDALTHDIREAAFFGCAGQDPLKTGKFLNALNNNTRLLFDFQYPVYGYEAISTSAWNETPDSDIVSPLTGRDILVVRTVIEGGGPIVERDKVNLKLSVSENSGIIAGDILLANTCEHAFVFQATSVATNAKLDIISAAVGVQTPGNSTNSFLKIPPLQDGELRRIVTRVYYIADNAAGLPSLFLLPSNGAAQEIAEGVEDMQISYGIDTDGNYGADSYVAANAIDKLDKGWNKVVSVSITLTYISPEDHITTTSQSNAMGTGKDSRMRRQISNIIALRNRAG